MADEDLRARERSFNELGGVEQAVQHLAELVRSGSVSRERVQLLAEAGDPLAATLLGLDSRDLLAFRAQALPQLSEPARRFLGQLAEAQVWCSETLQGGGDLRDPRLEGREEPLGTDVERLVATRSALLAEGGWYPEAIALAAGTGRLLQFNADVTLFDGSAEVASGGFFDEWNVPPCGTWVAQAELDPDEHQRDTKLLVAWVPPSLVEAAAEGILVNPEGCLEWFTAETPAALARELAEFGLLELWDGD